MNIPREEDFIFLVTALWHWYSKHTPSTLQLYNDPDEMEILEVPPEEKKEDRKEEQKEEGKAEELKKRLIRRQLNSKRAAEEAKGVKAE